MIRATVRQRPIDLHGRMSEAPDVVYVGDRIDVRYHRDGVDELPLLVVTVWRKLPLDAFPPTAGPRSEFGMHERCAYPAARTDVMVQEIEVKE